MGEKDFENAENMIVKALMIQPNNEDFLLNYYILIKLGKTKESMNIDKKLNIGSDFVLDEINGLNRFCDLKFINKK